MLVSIADKVGFKYDFQTLRGAGAGASSLRLRLGAVIERAQDGTEIGKQGPRSVRHTIEDFEDQRLSVSDPMLLAASALDGQTDSRLRVLKQALHTSHANGKNQVVIESYIFLNSGSWVDPVSGAVVPVFCGHVALSVRIHNWHRCSLEAQQEGCAQEEEGSTLEVQIRMQDSQRWAARDSSSAQSRLSSGYTFDTDAGSGSRMLPGQSYLTSRMDSPSAGFTRRPPVEGEECRLKTEAGTETRGMTGRRAYTVDVAEKCLAIGRLSLCLQDPQCKYETGCGCIAQECSCGDSCCLSGACGGLDAGRTPLTGHSCEVFRASFRNEAPDQIMSVRFPLNHADNSDTFIHSSLMWLAGPGDTDSDGILDRMEGPDDLDGDGFPNLMDLDSDGDLIPDTVEGSVDSDSDGFPNFLDLDSDNDGITDRIEGVASCLHGRFLLADTDGDGRPDYISLDSDGDTIPDTLERGSSDGSADEDRDLLPNFRDLDSDGDYIPDSVEGFTDLDNDGIPNYLDLDSDADEILDMYEGSDDTDKDGVPNYLDLDSDDDGIFSCSCFPTLICIILAVAPSVVLETFQTSS
jgi:hypothetical protein